MWAQGKSSQSFHSSSLNPTARNHHFHTQTIYLYLTRFDLVLIPGLTVGTLITSAIVTGAAGAQAKPVVRTDHSWEDMLGESTRVLPLHEMSS
jgi:hypothetical protein